MPPELNTSASWESYWDGIKLAYLEWLTGLDQANAALEEDYQTLRMLYASSDDMSSRIIKQSGLRMTPPEEVTKSVDDYKRRLQHNPDPDTSKLRHTANINNFAGPSSTSDHVASSSSSSSNHEV
jgi:hypothetical protein